MINIGIVGLGNLGKAVYNLCEKTEGVSVSALFTKRSEQFKGCPLVYDFSETDNFIGKLDVMVVCTGSCDFAVCDALKLSKNFNVIDVFDNHSAISDYKKEINQVAKQNKHTCFISVGWDPGIFSLIRGIFGAICKNQFTFWGKGISMGHSNALRQVEGVKGGVSFTIPVRRAKRRIKKGKPFSGNLHKRICFVNAKGNKRKVAREIKNISDYFSGQNVKVKFCGEKKISRLKKRLYHGGSVIANARYGADKSSFLFGVKSTSNPNLTASIVIAYVFALSKFYKQRKYGAYSVFDIPLKYITQESNFL